ncbi:MAG: macro domain-containing protein [Deltaproteobacteria bacterium]|nr:macro domain-containing protein [Deltaproteobacteria bacterium]
MQVHVAKGDLTNLNVDALVNPGNSEGTMRTGVSERIRKAGGDQIEAEAKRSAPIAIGAALLTDSGGLQAKKIIHVPIMEAARGTSTSEEVRRATRAALVAASAKQLASIAIPAMGSFGEGVPLDEMARAIVEEVRAHKKDFPTDVYLVDERDHIVELLEESVHGPSSG